jgi:hypothetical protein
VKAQLGQDVSKLTVGDAPGHAGTPDDWLTLLSSFRWTRLLPAALEVFFDFLPLLR